MVSVLPVVVKAQPYLEDDYDGHDIFCDLKHAEYFRVDEVLRERLGWEKEVGRLVKEREELKTKMEKALVNLDALLRSAFECISGHPKGLTMDAILLLLSAEEEETTTELMKYLLGLREELLGLSKQ